MLTLSTREALFDAMHQGAALVTPNNRLSNQLLQDYFSTQQRYACTKPFCLPYQAFLQMLFQKARHIYAHHVHPIVLNNQQETYLWHHIITQSGHTCHLGLLKEIQEAYTRCQAWQIQDDFSFDETPQTQLFYQWWQKFNQSLQSRGAITAAQLATHLLNYPEIVPKTSLVWVCFDEFSPQQQNLQAWFETSGVTQYLYDLEAQVTAHYLYAAQDSQDELLQIITWAKQRLDEGDHRIGIVIPDLQTQAKSLQRLFDRHLDKSLFNISLGQALADYPLVAHALLWLKLGEKLSHHQLCLLLQSPYLAGTQSESMTRAEIMQNHSLLQQPTVLLKTWISAIQEDAPLLADKLKHLITFPQQATAQQWVDLFKTRLIGLGFPGERTLTSDAYQCLQRLWLLFDEFLSLAFIQPVLSQTEAVQSLQHLAATTIFQLKTPTRPIQILGLLEASGCYFDSLWVSGLTNTCLPQQVHLSAFIPIKIQREQGMPRAVPLRELQFAKQWLQRFQHGSKLCIFSYPRYIADTPQLPSPILQASAPWPALTIPTRSATTALISYQEEYRLPLKPNMPFSGGTALLANQAKCPFRAFATHRLHAKPAPEVLEGLDSSQRGQLMHKIMELLWLRLQTQANLLSLSSFQLDQLIQEIMHEALGSLVQLSSLSKNLEEARLTKLVHASLEWEKQRLPFVVEAIEQTFTLHLGGFDFKVRVDRLDRLENQKKWVIDYKTTLPPTAPWYEERPEAPQLLLYALLDVNIEALLFIQLKAGRLICSGLCETEVAINGVSGLKKGETWAAKLAQWQQQLIQLANEFREGHCPPTPNRPSTCQQCYFPALCRI